MSKSSARKFTHWVRPTLDLLECRVTPTTTQGAFRDVANDTFDRSGQLQRVV